MSDFVKGVAKPADASAPHPGQRVPKQGRSQERIARVLEAAERLLVELGPEGASIPEIAVAADVPRASIYQYYPDKYALFAQLAETHMEKLKAHILSPKPRGAACDWRKMVRDAVKATAGFYNMHPVAGILLLKGPFGEKDREAHLAKDAELAHQFRLMISTDKKGPRLPKKPDAVAIAIELAFAVLQYGYAREETISSAISEEAARAAISYLSEWA
jgi:AcrR family transcriptional regulator